MFDRGYWYWLGVGVLIAYSILFNFLYCFFLIYLNRKWISNPSRAYHMKIQSSGCVHTTVRSVAICIICQVSLLIRTTSSCSFTPNKFLRLSNGPESQLTRHFQSCSFNFQQMHIVHSTLAPSCILELNLAEGVMQPVFCCSFHFSCQSLISKQPHINHYRGLQYHSKLSCGLTTQPLAVCGERR